MHILVRNLTSSIRILNLVQPTAARFVHASQVQYNEQSAKPRNRTNCTLIPGDGVGPELVYALQEIFKAADVPINFDTIPISDLNPVPKVKFEEVKKSIKKNKICIKGTFDRTEYTVHGLYKSLNMRLRNELGFFANVVHAQSFPGIQCRHSNVDTIIIRENTEGEYSALEHESVPGVVECLKIITADKSKRIAKFAFDYATRHKRKKVTAVHKANIMKIGDGLFLSSCEQMAQLYPRIKFEKMIVDNTTMQMISNPKQFDVMVTPNLYGNIVNNLATGLVGGAGVVPGATYSSEAVLFEPGAHHTYAKAVGKDLANPTAMLLCGSAMLRHINLLDYSNMIISAITKVLRDGKVKTKDMGGNAGTKEYIAAIINNIQ